MLPTYAASQPPDRDRPRDRWHRALSPSLKRRPARAALLVGAGATFLLWWFLFSFDGPPRHRAPSVIFDFDQEPFDPPPEINVPPPPEIDVPPPPPPPPSPWPARAEEVKQAFLHAYTGYLKYASPHDELLPLSNKSQDNFNGWGVTMIDSLDTMFLMGLHDEFQQGVALVENMTFVANNQTYAPFFETTIRYLGGLLSAYALSGELVLLQRADELGAALLPAFDTPSGFPAFAVNPATGDRRASGWSGWQTGWLAEIGTCQLEYKYLAHVTGKRAYYRVADRVTATLHAANVSAFDGMLPTLWNLTDGTPVGNHVSVGATADSAYEYFLKQWLLTDQTETASLELYLRTMDGVLDNLLYLSPTRRLLYVTDVTIAGGARTPARRLEHLSCFLPGLLALGARALPAGALPPATRDAHAWAAEGLAHACWALYDDQPAGLAPDEATFFGAWDVARARAKQAALDAADAAADGAVDGPPGVGVGAGAVPPAVNDTEWDEQHRWAPARARWDAEGRSGAPPGLAEFERAPIGAHARDYRANNPAYFLRPETVESFYIMWRTTGDAVWRARGWAVFEALVREARTASGFASLWNVQVSPASQKDEMPSFFLAETLKYLYLLFSDEDPVPLDRWVFNTEAHPLPVFQWSSWEKKKFGIA